MQGVLFDSHWRQDLLPLTYARPAGELRCGILTLREKWERVLQLPVATAGVDYLRELFPPEAGEDNLLINAHLLPDPAVVSWLRQLPPDKAWFQGGKLVAARTDRSGLTAFLSSGDNTIADANEVPSLPLRFIRRPADLFSLNEQEILRDFQLVTAGRESAPLSATNTLIGPRDQLFLEAGVTVEACILNVSAGPIYIGADAVILEGAMIKGPMAAGAGAILKMGAKVYGGTTVGPHCKVGGEISNVIFQANTNKGHDGYLGNAFIGEWCNLGADTNASNLKNDYGSVKTWSYRAEAMVDSGLQFHGLIMGDHSKTAINTMLNTGASVGFSSNVFGTGFPPAFLPSFIWGGVNDRQTYRLDKALATARRVMQRRGQEMTEAHERVFARIFADSETYRAA